MPCQFYFFFFFRSLNVVLSGSVHKQHTDRSAKDRYHGQVRSGEIRDGGYSDAVPGQNTHIAGRQSTGVETVRRAPGRGRAVLAGPYTGRAAVAAPLEKVERIRGL